LIDLPRQAWPKLKYYEAQEFEGLFTYLTNDEISKLNFNQLQVIKKELMNLVFVIGMAHGFTIFNKFEKESDDNES